MKKINGGKILNRQHILNLVCYLNLKVSSSKLSRIFLIFIMCSLNSSCTSLAVNNQGFKIFFLGTTRYWSVAKLSTSLATIWRAMLGEVLRSHGHFYRHNKGLTSSWFVYFIVTTCLTSNLCSLVEISLCHVSLGLCFYHKLAVDSYFAVLVF